MTKNRGHVLIMTQHTADSLGIAEGERATIVIDEYAEGKGTRLITKSEWERIDGELPDGSDEHDDHLLYAIGAIEKVIL